MHIAYVHPENVGATWPLIREWVIGLCNETGGRRTPAKLLAELMEGGCSLWVGVGDDGEVLSFMTTRIIDYDAVRLLGIEMVGGKDLEVWQDDGMTVFQDFAKKNGCSGLEGYGRGRAWARKLKDYGWDEISTMIELRWD